MLIYNQSYDLYHTIFRIMLLSSKISKSIEIDKMRILDFYFVYPTELLEIKKPKWFRKYERFLKPEINKYDKILSPKRIFFKMNTIQSEAIKTLVAYGYFEAGAFENGIIKKTQKELPSAISQKIEEALSKNLNLITLLTGPLSDMDLSGHLGLKERTGLIEFRYDSI